MGALILWEEQATFFILPPLFFPSLFDPHPAFVSAIPNYFFLFFFYFYCLDFVCSLLFDYILFEGLHLLGKAVSFCEPHENRDRYRLAERCGFP